MGKSFIFMILLGAAIGLMLPAHRSAPAAPPPAAAHAVTASAAADPGPAMTNETKLERAPNGHFYAEANVNGQPVRLLVDTGATCVALTVADAQRIGVPFSPNEATVVGTGASGPLLGEQVMFDRVEVDGKEVRNVRGMVVEGLTVSLLGQTYLDRIGSVQMSGDTMTLR